MSSIWNHQGGSCTGLCGDSEIGQDIWKVCNYFCLMERLNWWLGCISLFLCLGYIISTHPSTSPPVLLPCMLFFISLHLTDGIEACSPVWVYWGFPMECFCRILQPWTKSQCFPFANLNNHVVAMAQIAHIKIRYNLHEKLSQKQRNPQKGFHAPNCESFHYPFQVPWIVLSWIHYCRSHMHVTAPPHCQPSHHQE